MKLYHNRGACSQVPFMIAQELQLDLEVIHVDLATGMLADGTNFATINPKGYVPALVLNDGTLLTEGPAISLYLASLKPEGRLTPEIGSVAYFEHCAWLNYIGTEIHKTFGVKFMKIMGRPVSEAAIEAADNLLGVRYQYVEDILAKQPYLMGDQITCADFYLYVTLTWCKNLAFDLSRFPHIERFYQTMSARPSVNFVKAYNP